MILHWEFRYAVVNNLDCKILVRLDFSTTLNGPALYSFCICFIFVCFLNCERYYCFVPPLGTDHLTSRGGGHVFFEKNILWSKFAKKKSFEQGG